MATTRKLPYGIRPASDVPPPMAPASAALTKLQRTLAGDLNRQGGNNSALVVDETTGRTLWDYNSTVGRLPASVEKLYTTTAALLELGPNATFQTQVLGDGTLTAAGTFIGTLYLRGGGDPSLGSSTFDRINYGGSGSTMGWLAAALKRDGVRRIEGAIIGDSSYLDSLRGGPDTHYQANIETEGSLSALVYDAGFTNLHEDELDADPPLVATQAFASALQRAGVSVPSTTSVTTGITPQSATLLTSERSPTLATLIRLTDSPSDNFFAETLLKDLGAQFGAGGSTVSGAAVVRGVIGKDLGLHPRLDDGSGLSRYDLTNARQIVLLLRELQDQRAFWNSLAIAGVRGTMVKEMRHTPGANNCRGKTGTLHDVANLVGYCRAANGDRIIFALMMNGLTDSTAGHQLEDLDAEALARYRG
ncbi:MAG TPA: D-alanyl-D-alanine carboxypeptidase/D-alanyl-D-alanine-endopeptidase [Solirubrobacteraceae bacterium]|nr:D-alanyl-D-alanine carboxypeptidase/D-alanyl-D-alanine-endopeptidase [Solirubrobacteraceae bacterium]